ncbi:hypothetical protein HDE_06546 [Halotydeus destructor]|nr:hypothetical protein HDE_06546 [Halotydeus destructor]
MAPRMKKSIRNYDEKLLAKRMRDKGIPLEQIMVDLNVENMQAVTKAIAEVEHSENVYAIFHSEQRTEQGNEPTDDPLLEEILDLNRVLMDRPPKRGHPDDGEHHEPRKVLIAGHLMLAEHVPQLNNLAGAQSTGVAGTPSPIERDKVRAAAEARLKASTCQRQSRRTLPSAEVPIHNGRLRWIVG